MLIKGLKMASIAKNRQAYCYPQVIRSLIVSDSFDDSKTVSTTLEKIGIQVECGIANSIDECKQKLADESWNLTICCQQDEGDFSSSVVKAVFNSVRTIPVLAVVSEDNPELTKRILSDGAEDVFEITNMVRLEYCIRKLIHHQMVEEKLKFNEGQAALYLASSGEGFWDWYIDEGVVQFSERWVSMLYYSYEDFDQSFSHWLDLIHPDDLGNFLTIWTDYMDGESDSFSIEYRILDGKGNYRWIEARGASVSNGNNEKMHLAGSHNDITVRKEAEAELYKYRDSLEKMIRERTSELEALNEKLSYMSSIDELTDIPNRRSFNDYIDQQFRRSQREGEALSLMLIDIDFFKAMNDTYGHAVGDECIRAVASALKHSVHRPTDQVARYGGEEFAVLLPNTDLTGAKKIGKEILSKVASLNDLPVNPKSNKSISVSIGLNSFEPKYDIDEVEGIDGFIAEADKALYKAKENGRDRLVVSY